MLLLLTVFPRSEGRDDPTPGQEPSPSRFNSDIIVIITNRFGRRGPAEGR